MTDHLLQPSVLLVGGGPAALAQALALRCHDLADDLTVLDPSGRWFAAWDDRFRRQDIPHLRSPAVHHPHPDPFALLGAGGTEGLVPSGGTKLPATARFASFVERLVDEAELRPVVRPVAATSLHLEDGRAIVEASDGTVCRPGRVVLATNRRFPVVPGGLRGLDGDPRLIAAEHADVARTPSGGRVVVVGGGLSAAHLAIGAARRGAHVTLLTRRGLTVRRFDVHPSWLGPKKRRPFEAEPDPHRRRDLIDRARGGGSVPHRVRRELEACRETGRLTLLERCEVVDVGTHGEELRLRCSDGGPLAADQIWLGTGGQVDVARDPLCGQLLAEHPTPIAGGLPELAADLSWPGTNVHLAGSAAALRLGPTAGNLVGHRRAALRVTASVRGDDPDRADRISTGASACPTAVGVPGAARAVRVR
jgi:cation diffusion facilitator CzcD-associated flavoprotein CzcO